MEFSIKEFEKEVKLYANRKKKLAMKYFLVSVIFILIPIFNIRLLNFINSANINGDSMCFLLAGIFMGLAVRLVTINDDVKLMQDALSYLRSNKVYDN